MALRSRRFARLAYGKKLPRWLAWFQGLGLPDSVLDVGCGSGDALVNMWQQGFRSVVGCDPHLEHPFDNGELQLIKAEAAGVKGCFDVVMAHHSFEHMADPHDAIEQLRRLARRRIVLAVPVPGFGWREYGVNWVGLDPPRHLHIVTPNGMRRLADAHGLCVARTYFEPDSLYLWGSEQYEADVPLRDGRSYYANREALTPEQVTAYDRRARELSAAGDGDVAVFFLEPVGC
jgi:SAM-dependent methyltransferase